jgi:ribosomal protein S21
MAVNVEISRGSTENSLSALRRFTKRVQTSGVLTKVRSKRYSERNRSENVKKKKALKRIGRKDAILADLKMGKVVERKRGRR